MLCSRSSFDTATLSAWRGQLAATGARRGLRTQLLQHRQELLPRFASVYRQLRALPRRVRKAMQRCWGVSLAGVALVLTVQPSVSEAANFIAGTAAELITAINTANSTAEADTITLTADITLSVADSTLYGPTGLPLVRTAITIVGNTHTIRRDPSAPPFRLLMINNTGNLTVQDTTLSGGMAAGGGFRGGEGGGIFNYGQLTLQRCTVSGNSAEDFGGGVYNHGYGPVALVNSTISGNTARFQGGGVYNRMFRGTFSLINSTVSDNATSGRGGGITNIVNFGSVVQLVNSTVSGNTSGTQGGGIYSNAAASTVTITNSSVSGNLAEEAGGGVYSRSYGGTVRLVNSTVTGNSAINSGGGVGIGAYSGGTVALINSTVRDNKARYSGGVNIAANREEFINGGGTVMLVSSTVNGNTAGGNGGGVGIRAGSGGVVKLINSTVSGNRGEILGGGVFNSSNAESKVDIVNSTIHGNTADEAGGGIWSNTSGTLEISRSLISGNTAFGSADEVDLVVAGLISASLNLVGHKELTIAEALFGFPTSGSENIIATSDGNRPTLLASILDTTLQNNGGLTATHNLVSGSPAIDSVGVGCEPQDQRGAPRPVDGDGVFGASCDAGAVEFSSVPRVLDCAAALSFANFPWPPDRHRYKVDIFGVANTEGGPVNLTIERIRQDEPLIKGLDRTCPDGIGVGTSVAKVRNEREGTAQAPGDGRVYHISFTATDGAGDSCKGEVQVCVPYSQGGQCVDEGALFKSTVCP